MVRRAVALVLTTLLALAGCDTGGNNGPRPTTPPAEETASSVGPEQLSGYCAVQAFRVMLEAGETTLEPDPPSWLDTTVVDGTPRVVDYTTAPEVSSGAIEDRLREMAGRSTPSSWLTTCIALTTDGDIVRTQGDLGHLADPDAPIPDPAPARPVPSLGPDLGAYCYTQHLRALIADGTIEDTSSLPAEADGEVIDDTPRLIDFTTAPETVLGHYELLDRILTSARENGRGAAESQSAELADVIRQCAETTTDADVERTQGGPGYATERS